MADSRNKIVDQILEFDGFFDGLVEDRHLFKNSLASEIFRTTGNTLYTKKNHSKDDHKDILSLYTRCISYAPNNSEDLAKGYSNRSALLMHLHQYEECLVDINRALQITKSDALKDKLESRKQNCLKLCSDKSTRICSEEVPPIQPSAKILNASEAVDVKYNDVFGRHLVATRDVKPGEIIIVEEGYACFPKKHKIHITCSHCMAFAWNGIPCDTCVFAIFCSDICKQAAWQEYHDVECSIIPFMFFDKEAHITNVMVAVRLFIKAVKNEGFDNVMNEAKIASEKKSHDIERLLCNGILVSNTFRSCYNLLTHTQDKMEQGLDDNFYKTLIVNLLLRRTSIIPVDMSSNVRCKTIDELLVQLVNIFTKLIDILDVNSFKYQASICGCSDINKCKNLCDTTSGSLISASCSLINHSCCPNVSRMFVPQRKVVMYTVAPVKKGQQFCDSYGPTFTLERKERQKYLKKNFHFTCRCTACEENWPSNLDLVLFSNPVASAKIINKVMKEFEKSFPGKKGNSIETINELVNQHQFDRSTLEKVIRFSELVYKYFDYRQAFYRNLGFSMYIDRSFFHFYGENPDILKNC